MRSKHLIALILLGTAYACGNATTSEQQKVPSSAEEMQASQTASTSQDSEKAQATIVFEETEYDFGTIKEGEVVEHVFRFTNTGQAPLLIQDASAPCGCTVPSWTKEPIEPGKQGEIVVRFDSKGRVGQQTKQVTITANTKPEISQIAIKAFVEGSGNTILNTEGPRKQ